MPAAMALARAAVAAALCAARVQAAGARLRITNGCGSAPIWIAHEAGPGTGPDPQNVRIEPMQFHDFRTDDGLSSTRYWPKMGCDAEGNNCGLGGSGGPREKCVGTGDYKRCAPPIDTKFEASFGHSALPCDPATNSMGGCDYVDVSLVDGWTLPFHLELNGHCEGQGGAAPHVIDCSGLSYGICPTAESFTTLGTTVSLQAVNPYTGTVSGCYSPCSKLIDTKWRNELAHGRHTQDPAVAPYCCPTPPESPQACRAGPVKDTAYVQAMHRFCPGVYGYSYDDATGLLRCPSATSYNMVFHCPAVLPGSPSMRQPVLGPRRTRSWRRLGLAALALLLLALLLLALRFVICGPGENPGRYEKSALPMAQQQAFTGAQLYRHRG